MLPKRLRLRRSADFVPILKHGYKVGTPSLVLYALASQQSRFGLIVGRKAGGAVVRNQVKRRLRHLAAELIDEIHPMDVVVRTLPAVSIQSRDLSRDLTAAWHKASKVVLP